MKDRITREKIEKYLKITKTALIEAERNIAPGKEEQAEEILSMVKNYVSDAEHFKKNKDLVNSFAALNYAHGWLDTGARLGIFNVKDNKLFTIK